MIPFHPCPCNEYMSDVPSHIELLIFSLPNHFYLLGCLYYNFRPFHCQPPCLLLAIVLSWRSLNACTMRSQSHIKPWMLSSRIPRRQTTSTCAEAMTAIAVPAAFASSSPARFPSTAASSHARAKRSLSYTTMKRRDRILYPPAGLSQPLEG
ncbi:hypothetical protein HDV62DRAFT_284854 [Trichoderma sp. SZMC 28011]